MACFTLIGNVAGPGPSYIPSVPLTFNADGSRLFKLHGDGSDNTIITVEDFPGGGSPVEIERMTVADLSDWDLESDPDDNLYLTVKGDGLLAPSTLYKYTAPGYARTTLATFANYVGGAPLTYNPAGGLLWSARGVSPAVVIFNVNPVTGTVTDVETVDEFQFGAVITPDGALWGAITNTFPYLAARWDGAVVTGPEVGDTAYWMDGDDAWFPNTDFSGMLAVSPSMTSSVPACGAELVGIPAFLPTARRYSPREIVAIGLGPESSVDVYGLGSVAAVGWSAMWG